MDMSFLEGKTLEEAFGNANKEDYKLKNEDLSDKLDAEDLSGDECTDTDNEGTRTHLKVKLRESKNPRAVVIGLNPSKAKAGKINGDKTIPILAKALYGLGFGEFIMLNLYTIRESDSKKVEIIAEEKGGLENNITKFKVYGNILDKADAIFVVVGKSSLGNDPRNEDFKGPKKEHEEAIKNMITSLEGPRAEKTWGVKLINDLDGSTITWNVHPSARSIIWTNDHDEKIIERFPVDVYLDKMGLGKQKRNPTTMETSSQSYESSSH